MRQCQRQHDEVRRWGSREEELATESREASRQSFEEMKEQKAKNEAQSVESSLRLVGPLGCF